MCIFFSILLFFQSNLFLSVRKSINIFGLSHKRGWPWKSGSDLQISLDYKYNPSTLSLSFRILQIIFLLSINVLEYCFIFLQSNSKSLPIICSLLISFLFALSPDALIFNCWRHEALCNLFACFVRNINRAVSSLWGQKRSLNVNSHCSDRLKVTWK